MNTVILVDVIKWIVYIAHDITTRYEIYHVQLNKQILLHLYLEHALTTQI